MVRTFILPASLALAALFAPCFSATAQTPTTSTEAPPKLLRESPIQDVLPMPPAKRALAVEVLPIDKMSVTDRQLEASSESGIARRARFWGMDLRVGKWTYEQVSCPAYPNHVLLRFIRNQGPRDISIFTASIPRHSGDVRLMPLVRRGYSLYTPAKVNPLTLSTFNRISAEEKLGENPDWLAVSLCYAAFAGANVQIDVPESQTTQPKTMFPAWTPVVMMMVSGGATVKFTDNSAKPQPMEWTLTFDRQGRMKRAEHKPNPALKFKELVAEPTDMPTPTVRTQNSDQPPVLTKRTKNSNVPDVPVIRTPNNDQLPLPQGSQPAPQSSPPAGNNSQPAPQ